MVKYELIYTLYNRLIEADYDTSLCPAAPSVCVVIRPIPDLNKEVGDGRRVKLWKNARK